MPDDPAKPPRSTSFAKELDDKALLSIQEIFARAVTGQEQERGNPGQPPAKGHAPAPIPDLRPAGPIARAVDRAADSERQDREDRRAREINDALKARGFGRGRPRGKDDDRDR